MNEYIELAKKLKRLADGGAGGEKYNAQRQLDRIMAKHGITKGDLEEDSLWEIEFKVPQSDGDLLVQVSMSVVGKAPGRKVSRTKYVIQMTKLQEAEIRAKFSFYQRVYKDQLKLFYHAFIIKNGIFDKTMEPRDPESLTPEERIQIAKILELSQSIERSEYHKPLK